MIENHPESGSSFAKTAIILILAGVLVGGMIKFIETFHNLRINGVVRDVAAMRLATENFRTKYNALPGDMGNAMQNIPGCTQDNNCTNGNASMTVGATTVLYANNNQAGTFTLPQGETTQFWKHLALTGYLGGVKDNANPTAPAWGYTHPACVGCGGYSVLHIGASSSRHALRTGHYVLIRRDVTGNPETAEQNGGAISAYWASEIDNKLDDGNANTGTVRAPQAGGLCAEQNGNYNVANKNKNCILLIRLAN